MSAKPGNDAHQHDHDCCHDHKQPPAVADACCGHAPAAESAALRAVLLNPAGCCSDAGCGCGDRPVSLKPTVVQLAPAGSIAGAVTTRIRILQMDCPVEENLLRNRLGNLAGVASLEFNLMQRVLTVTHAPEILESVLGAIRALSFSPEVIVEGAVQGAPAVPAQNWWPLAVASVAALGAELAHWCGQADWLVGSLAVIGVLLCGITTFKKGWISVRYGNLNINALMSIAVTGALLIGQWPEAAMVMVLFTLAERIEALSLDRARRAVGDLLLLAPEQAWVQQVDGSWLELPARSVEVGARVRVRPGERLALDGRIVSGHSTLNQAPITGESLPVEKGEGDTVFAGAINETGSFEFVVTAAAADSTLARIIHAIEAAQGAKAPMQRFVDKFARIYTPLVLLFAVAVAVFPPLLLGGAWLAWIYKALVLLVIACPCALVISTPVTIVSGLAMAARLGILVKGGVYLEEGRKLTWLALDKTGTLTHGKPAQTDFAPLSGLDPAQVRSLAASLAVRSDHPVSRALAEAAAGDSVLLQEVEGFEALPGRGVLGRIGGKRYVLGNHRVIHESGLCSDALEARLEMLEQQGKSVIVLADDAGVHGLFAVADTVKPGSRAALEELRTLGVKTLMLTGDNAHTAKAIAAQVGVDEVCGELLPEDKLRAIEEHLAGGALVGMVGDGINDAPALARASIGFAMGAAGTGTAIETADVALMDDDLRKLPQFIRLSQRTHTILIQNIALALGIKAVFLVLTLVGAGTMWMAVFADVGTSLLVVGNGLRLLHGGRGQK
jgi:Cd2+/Zn2+-exporting ATPase